MKKAILLLLCLSFVFSLALCSCGKDDENETTANRTVASTTKSGNTGTSDSSSQTLKQYPTFDGREIKIQLSSYDDPELSSGGKKYMQGPDNTVSDKVQTYVYERNREAYDTIGVNVEYSYISKGWSTISNDIYTTESSKDESIMPDMYCDMIYDMTMASTRSCFYNVKNLTVESGEGYFDFKSENGYLTDFMTDLTLSNDKMYIIGSQYYIDLIRGMEVMPLNLTLYQSSVGDVVDFYNDIMHGKWTWDALMTISRNIWNDRNGDGSTMDDMLGFAAETAGGKSASGIIYSTDIKLLTVTEQSDGSYSFSYDPNNEQLYAIFNKIANVFSTDGVVAYAGGTAQSESADISEKFASGTLLFGACVMMGAVEEDVYQQMENSFGLIPIPKMTEEDSYNTLIHNVARCGAISLNSKNLDAISAFIQYCSENSEKVVDEYYNYAMKYKYTSDAGTAEMLDMIYDNVVAIREKALDDLIGFTNSAAGSMKWHGLLISDENDYKTNASQISTVYNEAIRIKKNTLDQLTKTWANLP